MLIELTEDPFGCELAFRIDNASYSDWTLGQPFFRAYEVEFDLDEMRMGFAPLNGSFRFAAVDDYPVLTFGEGPTTE